MQRRVATLHKHVQEDASDTWIVAHNLHMYPVVDCYTFEDGDLIKVLPASVKYLDGETCEIKFSYPVTGIAVVS